MKRIIALAALGGLCALPACTSGQSAAEPPKTIANVSASELQFQVGTANYSGTTYLNTVVTFRQPNGLSALLLNTPAISLPFNNTAPNNVGGTLFAADDSGKPQITGTQQVNNGQTPTDPRTFPTSVGAFAYGFLASNSITTGANNSVFYPGLSSYEAMQSPLYGSDVAAPAAITQVPYYVGPPFATISPAIGTTFLGYPSGFTSFRLTPTVGTYALTVGLPNASTPVPTFTSTTSLTKLTPLPTFGPVTYVGTGAAGGGTISFTIPAGLLETALFFNDNGSAFYTVVYHTTGAQTYTVPAGTFASGDTITISVVGFDYPAMEAVPMAAGPPQAPVINNSGGPCSGPGITSTCPGQADITVSTTIQPTQ